MGFIEFLDEQERLRADGLPANLTLARYQRIVCEVLGWHTPTSAVGFDGASAMSRCTYCGKKILQDGQGNWF